MKLLYSIVAVLLLSCNSQQIPKTKLLQFDFDKNNLTHSRKGDTIHFKFNNPLYCPIQVEVISENFKETPLIVVQAKTDRTFSLFLEKEIETKISYKTRLGNPKKEISTNNISLPIKKNKKVRIIQGNNGTHSHKGDLSQYAIDFDIKLKDTICAATPGVVVGVIQDYKYGGSSTKWKGYDNFITLYDDKSGLFTQYAHLVQNGALVAIGDTIKMGQPIALSGSTGFSDVVHLHFNVLKPVAGKDLVSIPVKFIEGYNGIDLRKNDVVIKK